MNRLFGENEVLLHRLHKSRAPILFMFVFLPVWMFFGFMFLTPCYKVLFLGALTFNPSEYYLSGIIGLMIFIQLAVIIIHSYMVNQLVITNQRIYIRKGLTGKLLILNHRDICSFQHVFSTNKGNSTHRIDFYLACGKRIKTGNLFATMDSLQNLLALLRERFEGRGFSNQQLKQMKLQKTEECKLVNKRNILVLFLFLAPFLLSLILSILYFGGANKLGLQQNIQVMGTVEQKRINSNDKQEISGYELEIRNNSNNQRLTVPVEEDIFILFDESDKILIKAKKGSMGILYDQEYFKQ